MSGLPEVCTAKEHLEQNLQRRGKRRGLGSALEIEVLLHRVLLSFGESWAQGQTWPGQGATAQTFYFLSQTF